MELVEYEVGEVFQNIKDDSLFLSTRTGIYVLGVDKAKYETLSINKYSRRIQVIRLRSIVFV